MITLPSIAEAGGRVIVKAPPLASHGKNVPPAIVCVAETLTISTDSPVLVLITITVCGMLKVPDRVTPYQPDNVTQIGPDHHVGVCPDL